MGKTTKTELILRGSIYRVLIVLSIPIIINSLIQTLYNLADGLWVSKISSVHFAATAFVWPVNFLFISIGTGLSVAGTSLLSQLVGNGDYERAKEYTSQLMAATVLSSFLFTALGFFLSPHIIRLMGGTGELASLGNIYLRITFLDLPFLFVYFNINSIMHAQGDTITPMILSGASAILNVILIRSLSSPLAGALPALPGQRCFQGPSDGCWLPAAVRRKINSNPVFKGSSLTERFLKKSYLLVCLPASGNLGRPWIYRAQCLHRLLRHRHHRSLRHG